MKFIVVKEIRIDFNLILNTSKKQFLKKSSSVHITNVLTYNISDYVECNHMQCYFLFLCPFKMYSVEIVFSLFLLTTFLVQLEKQNILQSQAKSTVLIKAQVSRLW